MDRETLVRDVVEDSAFGEYGHLLFPVDQNIPADLTLEDVGDNLVPSVCLLGIQCVLIGREIRLWPMWSLLCFQAVAVVNLGPLKIAFQKTIWSKNIGNRGDSDAT